MRPAALACHGDRGAYTTGTPEYLDDVGEVDEARADEDVLAADPERTLPVPTLEALPEAGPNVIAQPEASRQVVRCRVVVLREAHERAAAVTKEGDADPHSLEQRPARSHVLQQERRCIAGSTKIIGVVGVALEPQVIPQPFRLLVGVGVTTDPGEQPGVVDDLTFGLGELQSIGQTQRHQTCPDHVLHRLAQAEIRTERKQRNELGPADSRGLLSLQPRHPATMPTSAGHDKPKARS
jgi:hypothetical protein